MKNCPFCKEEISLDARFCNHCGKGLTDQHDVPNEHQGEEKDHDEQLDEVGVPPLVEKQEIAGDDPAQPTEEVDTPVDPTTASNEQQMQQQTSTSEVQPKGKNRNKLYGSIIAIIAILGIGLYMLGDSLTSPEKVIENFQQAVEDSDVEALKEMLQSDDENMEITDEGIEGFIALYKAEPRELKNVVRSLREELRSNYTSYQLYPVSIEQDGKKWLIYDDYKLVILPVYFNVHTNYEGTTIYVGDEEVATADEDHYSTEIGPFMPGEYTIRGVLDNGFSQLDVEETVISSDPEFSKMVDLTIDASSVYFDFADYYGYSNLQEIRLYINGNDTGLNLVEDSIVRPLLTDGSMNAYFEADFPWGTLRTDEVPIDSTDIEIDFASNTEFQEEIIDIIMQYNTEFVELFTQVSGDHLTTVSIDFAELLMDEAMEQLNSGYEYQVAFHGADFYLESFYLTQDYTDIWFVEVDGIAYYEEALYEEGENATLEQIEDETRYTLGYDQTSEEWIVTGVSYPAWMDEAEMERYVVEDPEVFTSVWNDGSDTNEDEEEESN